MRASLVLAPSLLILLACGGAETPAADSAAPAAAPAPAMLTEADIAGTWNGTGTVEGDTASMTFTDVCANGTCTTTYAGSPDTTTSTYRIDGDSVIGTGGPRMDPMFKTNVTESWVLRIVNGTATGSAVIKMADKDSTLAVVRFQATKAP